MDKFYERLVGEVPSTFLTVQTPTIDSEYVIAEFIQAHIKLGTLVVVYSNLDHLMEIESLLNKYGIASSKVSTTNPIRGKVYILPITEAVKVMYDASILYLFKNVDYINGCLKFASGDKLVVTDTELVFPLDKIVFSENKKLEDGYSLYSSGFLKYAVKYFTDLFQNEESSVGKLFTLPDLLRDGKFMGMIVRLQSFSYSYLYETFRMTPSRTMILRFLESHLKDLLVEIQKKARFHLTIMLLQDFNASTILKICHENNLTIFSYLTPIQREGLFKRISSDIGLVINAIELKIWNYSTIYKYSLASELRIGKDFVEYNLQSLIKEVDFNCDFDILPNIISDFDNRKVIDICYNIKTRMFENISDDLREQIFVNVANYKDVLSKCIALHIWTYRTIYTYMIKHVVDNDEFTIFMNEHLPNLINEIIVNRDYALAVHLQNDFALLDVLDISRKIAVLFDNPTRKELYMQVADNPDYVRECFDLDVWPILDMYHYYIELGRTSGETHAIIFENLSLLLDKIEKNGEYGLLVELLRDYSPREVLLTVKKIGSGILVSLPEEIKAHLLEESFIDEKSLEAGLDLDLWDAFFVYQQSLGNDDHHRLAVSVLKDNLRKLVMGINQSAPQEVVINIFKDFDPAELFKEAKEYGENIFKNASKGLIEEIIKGISDDDKLIEWGMDNNIFTPKDLLDAVGKYNLKITKYSRYNIGDILFETDDKDLLARLIIEADVEEEAMQILKKKFKVFLAKDLKSKIQTLRNQGVTKDDILKGEEIIQTAMDNLLSSTMSKKEEKRLEKEERKQEKAKKEKHEVEKKEPEETKSTEKRLSDYDISADELLELLDEVK